MTGEPTMTEAVASQEYRGPLPAEALAKLRSTRVVNTPLLNIALVVDSMERGGAETLTAVLCRLQREQGHHPSVHCLYLRGVLGEQLRDDGFDVVLHHPTSFFGLMRSLHREFKRSTPDVVHFS